MTTYSLSAAHQIVQSALGFTVTPEQAATVARNFGITVEDPKPEPGLYIFGGRFPVVIDGDGDWWNLTLGSDPGMAYEDTPGDPKHLTPARVVPAEPVELTEEQVDELWKEASGHERASFAVVAVVNAALAKYGHGVA